MIENWEDAAFETDGRVTTFRTEHLEITFTGTGIEGGCPAERDNDRCYVCEDGGVTLRSEQSVFCGVHAAAKNGLDSFRAVRGAKQSAAKFFRKWELFLQRSRPKEYNAQGGTTT